MLKIAIHHRKGSFSEGWIQYCQDNKIDYKIVNAYDSEIIEQVEGCDIFMWHYNNNDYKDLLVAERVLFALEHSGKIVYPNFKTGWHFDDKVAQKYLFEAVKGPLVPSYVFYDKKEALDWVQTTQFPKVYKLKGGSGSANVKLIKNKKEANKIIQKSFGKGVSPFPYTGYVKEKKRHFSKSKDIKDLLKILYRFFIKSELKRNSKKEKDYAYFQDFIPNNKYDTRVVIIGSIAAAEKRYVRKNDFRASGSGIYDYDNINEEAIRIAFKISSRLNLQSVAFDFVIDANDNPLIVEISYGFGTTGIKNTKGYWDSNLEWHCANFIPENIIIENLLEDYMKKYPIESL